MKPYIIISPDYDFVSGGIKVMWGLYGWLLAKGQVVYMNRWPDVDRIAIYPEIQNGNPAKAKTIVRYILNKPGVMGGRDQFGNFVPGPTSFAPTDKLYYFSRMFGYTPDENHYMFLPVIDLHTFKNQHKKRSKTCYLIGKGSNRQKHPKDSIEITRRFAQDQQVLADLLNECRFMYCYDSLTAMTEVARLCGCAIKYYGDHTMDELKLYEPGINGINSRLDIDAFREHYINMIKLFEQRLDYFIEETQS